MPTAPPSAVAGFADKLRDKNVDDLIDDTRDFVRKSPGIAIGIAAVAGFALVRLIKTGLDDASRPRRAAQRRSLSLDAPAANRATNRSASWSAGWSRTASAYAEGRARRRQGDRRTAHGARRATASIALASARCLLIASMTALLLGAGARPRALIGPLLAGLAVAAALVVGRLSSLVRVGVGGLKALGRDKAEREALDARRRSHERRRDRSRRSAMRSRAADALRSTRSARSQQRLKPGNLADEAWDGVKDKGADLAEDAVAGGEEAARARWRWCSARWPCSWRASRSKRGGDRLISRRSDGKQAKR